MKVVLLLYMMFCMFKQFDRIFVANANCYELLTFIFIFFLDSGKTKSTSIRDSPCLLYTVLLYFIYRNGPIFLSFSLIFHHLS